VAAALTDKPTKPTHIESMALRPFRRALHKPTVVFAIEGLGMGWGLIDYRYRDLSIRLDAEKGYAIAFASLSEDFSPSWYFHDVLQVATGNDPGSLSTQELSERVIRDYDSILETLSSEQGRSGLAAIQSPHFAEWAAESAAWRDPAKQAAIKAQIEEARRVERKLWRPKYRDWAIIAALLAALFGLWAYSCFV
jgi:hypothetical protein